MANFNIAFLPTMAREGGYSNHPKDRGGETFRGITRKNFPFWPGWHKIDAVTQDARDSLKDDPELMQLAAKFYRQTFWDQLGLDQVESQAIACELFDSSVMVGAPRAAFWLQRTVNLLSRPKIVEDGRIGPRTIGAVNLLSDTLGEGPLMKTLNGLQFEYFHSIVNRDPIQEVFFKGWLTRVWEVRS
jgi:lysozyme family protein